MLPADSAIDKETSKIAEEETCIYAECIDLFDADSDTTKLNLQHDDLPEPLIYEPSTTGS